jgi:hypothetical protein
MTETLNMFASARISTLPGIAMHDALQPAIRRFVGHHFAVVHHRTACTLSLDARNETESHEQSNRSKNEYARASLVPARPRREERYFPIRLLPVAMLDGATAGLLQQAASVAVISATCFTMAPQPTGLRYCMNGVALSFTPRRA